jgi:hypothetical protein
MARILQGPPRLPASLLPASEGSHLQVVLDSATCLGHTAAIHPHRYIPWVPRSCDPGGSSLSGVCRRSSLRLPLPGGDVREVAIYFDSCRVLRNACDHDRAGAVSASDVEESVQEALAFPGRVFEWPASAHARLVPQK